MEYNIVNSCWARNPFAKIDLLFKFKKKNIGGIRMKMIVERVFL
ncbi:hypothetical protein LEP1GSC060_2610 [Leptospira weilii serovar Ranarum str. ICFT]|uniref:Uncharacterized protein n=1 Tax=Leptospira weilii serovar Ranarum str. ICFT TaxID=1218598 RepID=N1WJT4_9LEPT|nr:hypothetical protein LEP1GSC060_2610 [Leptospira weilii serovar Ranarum str. ICFT]